MSKINHKSVWFKIKKFIVGDKNRTNLYQIVNQKKIDTVFKNISLKKIAFLKLMLRDTNLMYFWEQRIRLKKYLPFVMLRNILLISIIIILA